MNNVIIVEQAVFHINRENPIQVAYGFVDEHQWRPIMLSTYVQGLPTPKEHEILYQLRGSNTRGYLYNTKLGY